MTTKVFIQASGNHSVAVRVEHKSGDAWLPSKVAPRVLPADPNGFFSTRSFVEEYVHGAQRLVIEEIAVSP